MLHLYYTTGFDFPKLTRHNQQLFAWDRHEFYSFYYLHNCAVLFMATAVDLSWGNMHHGSHEEIKLGLKLTQTIYVALNLVPV